MRLRLTLALVALATLAACDQAGGPKGSARAPIGGAPAAKAPATTAATPAAPNCPTVAPACPPHRVAHAARRGAKAPTVVAARQPTRTVRTISTRTLAPIPAPRAYAHRHDGLPARPYRYDELPRGEAEIILPYADDYADQRPPPHHGYSHYRRWGRTDGYRDDRRAEAPPPPPPPIYRRDDEGQRYDEDRRYEQRRAEVETRRHEESSTRWSGYDERRETFAPPPPAPAPAPLPPRPRPQPRPWVAPAPAPPPAPAAPRYDHYSQSGARYGQASGGYERREYRSYSEESSQSSSQSVEGDCCQASGQAAGFDSRGFLTWPGKTPR